MHIDRFREMYVAELQEARSFEDLLLRGLEKMAGAASDRELKQAFESHLEETRSQRLRLEAILKRLDVPPEHRDQAVEAMLRETDKMIAMVEPGPVRDAALIASAQRLEHYEIAVYGTLATYASCLGFEDDKQILLGILEEEKATDLTLSDIAVGLVNPTAIQRAG